MYTSLLTFCAYTITVDIYQAPNHGVTSTIYTEYMHGKVHRKMPSCIQPKFTWHSLYMHIYHIIDICTMIASKQILFQKRLK